MKNPQTTNALIFLTHNTFVIGGVIRSYFFLFRGISVCNKCACRNVEVRGSTLVNIIQTLDQLHSKKLQQRYVIYYSGFTRVNLQQVNFFEKSFCLEFCKIRSAKSHERILLRYWHNKQQSQVIWLDAVRYHSDWLWYTCRRSWRNNRLDPLLKW